MSNSEVPTIFSMKGVNATEMSKGMDNDDTPSPSASTNSKVEQMSLCRWPLEEESSKVSLCPVSW